jgi:hypothetical protein
MATNPHSKHVIKLNTEQIETLVNDAISFHPFFSPERAQILNTLFGDFFIPCANISLKKDKLISIPDLKIISQDPALIGYFAEFNNMLVKITSHGSHFLTLATPNVVEAVLNMDKKIDVISFGDNFIVPEELCAPGYFALLNILFEEYLWTIGEQSDKTQALSNVVNSYIHIQQMWKWMPKCIMPFYSYLSPLTPGEIFSKAGYAAPVVSEIVATITDFHNLRDKDEGDFTQESEE